MNATWQDVLTVIEADVPATTFDRWFRSLSAQERDNGVICLVADDEFDALFIEKNYADLIRSRLERVTGDDVRLRIEHSTRKKPKPPPHPPKLRSEQLNRNDPPMPEPAHSIDGPVSGNASLPPQKTTQDLTTPTTTEQIINAGLKLQYSFDQFVVGSSNDFAYAACRAVAQAPGQSYNPLFIYGSVGLGKTHLINAIGLEMLRQDPTRRVLYMTSEAFMNELIEHLKAGKMAAFRSRFRDELDALLIDDIQFIAGKEATQQEFFHTFNALHQVGTQIIITSDRYPHELPEMEERLRSRFQWGLIADIQAPGIETRLAILKKKADSLDLELNDKVALYLAENIRSNVRELEGALLRLHAFVGFNQRLLTLDLAKSLLRQFLQESARQVSVEKIQKLVCNYYNIRFADMKGKSRARAISLPRQVAMYLSKKWTGQSYPQLGEKFGGRDHTTVLAACRKVKKLLDSDKAISATVQNLERQLNTR